jgi:hypothetical protein
MYHSRAQSPRANSQVMASRTQAGSEIQEGKEMTSAFAVWRGQPVILQVAAGTTRVPLRGTIVGESDEALRVRIGSGWDVDIYKTMVLAVEEDSWMNIT